MTAKTTSGVRLLGALLLGVAFLASWTAWMYLPHGSRGSHIAAVTLATLMIYVMGRSYRRRYANAQTGQK